MSEEKQKLTIEQEGAINHFKGPALVIAGPGAGKTFVMTERVKNLITNHNVDPKKILVTTFTEKAANELKVKLAGTVGKNAELIHISTIHSFCKSMLEKYFLYHEYGSDIDVLDEESQRLLVDLKRVQLGLSKIVDGKRQDVKRAYDFIASSTSFFSTLSQEKIDPEELLIELKKQNLLEDGDEDLINAYKNYLELLRQEKKLDFSLLQTLFYDLINSNKDLLKDIQESFDFILVDEYQDTSPLQDKIFRLIVNSDQNLFVVGDENQSIYGFRGATIKNFMRFMDRYSGCKEYLLNTNFRSTKKIVELSNKIFAEKVKKILEAKRRDGEKVIMLEKEDSESLAEATIKLVNKLKEEGVIKKYGDIAFLFRSLKLHSPEYIKYLKKEGIPYITFGDGQFLEREEIRTIIYLISYVTQELYSDNNFSDWQNWWRKDILLNDFFNLNEVSKNIVEKGDFNLYELREEEDFKKRGFKDSEDIEKLKRLNHLKYTVESEKDSMGEIRDGKSSLLRIFYHLLDISGYFNRLMSEKTSENKERLSNIGRLSDLISKYLSITKNDDVKGFLWYMYKHGKKIDQDKIEEEDSIKLMTVHRAKGLEFPVVFLCCLNEGRFPLTFKNNNFVNIPKTFLDKNELDDEIDEHYEEEQRLFYVGITRAQDNLILTTSNKHKTRSWKKSRFLELIPDSLLSKEDFKIPAEKEYSLKKKIPTLNYSAINTFIDCPLRYTLVYQYNFVTPQSFTQNLGQFIHNSLQRIHEHVRKGEDVTPEKMNELVDRYWRDLPVSKKKNEEFKENYKKKLISYYISLKSNFKEIISIEESFSHIGDNVIVKGKVDLIAKDLEGNVCLVDFKARSKKGIEKTNIDKQLQIYDYCLDKKYDISKLMAYTFEDNKKTEFPIDKEGTMKFLKEMSEKMEKEDFNKKKNDLCQDCAFKFHCWKKNG